MDKPRQGRARPGRFLFIACVLLPFFALPAARGEETAKKKADPTFLWRIVKNCLVENPKCGGRNACPRPLPNTCGKGDDCKDTLTVLRKTDRYLAMEDVKMCHCQDREFFHGLVLPRIQMTGAEDQQKFPQVPDIWQFAWDVAGQRIPDEQMIALAANPPKPVRTQDQLHIHIVRLASQDKALAQPYRHVHDLGVLEELVYADGKEERRIDGVWPAVKDLAKERGWSAYGVLVIREPDRPGFRVVLVDKNTSPEREFTQYQCPEPAR